MTTKKHYVKAFEKMSMELAIKSPCPIYRDVLDNKKIFTCAYNICVGSNVTEKIAACWRTYFIHRVKETICQ